MTKTKSRKTKGNNIDDYDSYQYLRLAHVAAICFGFPHSRRKIKETDKREANAGNVAGRYRYSLDARLFPVWTCYLLLNAFTAYYNYLEGVRYVDGSFKTCFEESYCFALIELFNRNIGPSSHVACSAFYGRRDKDAGLAGAERALRFLEGTRGAAPGAGDRGLSRFVRVFAPVSLSAYLAATHFYIAMVPAAVVYAYWLNGMGQMVVYMLVFTQYYVLMRGFRRVNELVDAVDATRDPAGARLSLVRLSGTYDELCALVETVNRAYAPEMLVQWLYNIVRVIMVVFRLLEIASQGADAGDPASYLIAVEHVGELVMFAVHTSCTCTVGERLSAESKRILASLEKLKLQNGFHANTAIKKAVCIFYVRANARNVCASIGGLIIFNMGLVRCVCTVLATYILVLIQFRDQKGNSKPLYYNWH